MDKNLSVSQLDPISAGRYTGVGEAYLPWLGALPTMARVDPNEDRNVSVWNMPAAYVGRNVVLRDTIEDLGLLAHQTFVTTDILPIFITNDINMQWEHFEANAHLMEQTPYQTTSHAVSQKRSIRRAQLVRWGIMAEFEADFLRTAMGRMCFLATLNQIAKSAQETMEIDGVRQLAACHRYQHHYLRETGIPTEKLIQQWLETDRRRFATVQKHKNGLEKLDLLIDKELTQIGADTSNMGYIIPEEIIIHETIAKDEKTDYWLAGPRGPDLRDDMGARAQGRGGSMGNLRRIEPARLVRSTPVYPLRSRRLENMTEAESQLLTRSRQIGEYFTMLDECSDYSKYESKHRAILVYNQDIDDLTKITQADCIEHCGLWDESGNVRPAGYDSASNNRRDLDDDFLTFLSPAAENSSLTRKSPVEYFFDIAPEYLDVKHVLGAGETLLRRLSQTELAAIQGAIDNTADKTPVDLNGAALKSAVTKLQKILGGDHYSTVANANLLTWLFGGDLAPVTIDGQRGDAVPAAREGPVFVQSAMTKVFKAASPESKHAEIDAILAGPGSTKAKFDQVRDRLVEYVASGVQMPFGWKDAAPVDVWYDRQMNTYREMLKRGEGAVAAAAVGAPAGYMRRGQDLTGTGYRYLYPESAEASTDHIDALLSVHIAKCQDAANLEDESGSSESSLRPVGQGLGLAGIGRFVTDTREKRRSRNAAYAVNRLATLAPHLDALERSGGSEVIKTLARAVLGTRITKKNLLSMDANNVPILINFLIVRPHQQYRTRAIIKCALNGGAGLTGMGNSNLSIAHETGRKMAQMHYTTHFRSIIVNPKNVHVAPDVYVQEVEGGANCRFYDEESYAAMNNENLENSLLCFAVPVTETVFPMPLDISGRFLSDFGLGVPQQNERLHYSTAARYNGLYKFSKSAREGTDIPHMTHQKNHVNRICYPGGQFNWSNDSYSDGHPNRGHWGKNGAYPGCLEIRNGALDQFEKQSFSRRMVH